MPTKENNRAGAGNGMKHATFAYRDTPNSYEKLNQKIDSKTEGTFQKSGHFNGKILKQNKLNKDCAQDDLIADVWVQE